MGLKTGSNNPADGTLFLPILPILIPKMPRYLARAFWQRLAALAKFLAIRRLEQLLMY